MAASFQHSETGLDHQAEMPQVPPPENLVDAETHYRSLATELPAGLRRLFERRRPFEFRPVQPPNFLQPQKLPPLRSTWFRAVDALPDDDALHRCLLAYVSDFHLLDTATLPHGVSYTSGKLVMASIDHAMWFHRSVRVDDWLLYSTDSPSSSGARGFTRGSIFTRDGRLVASTAQEGLIRVISG